MLQKSGYMENYKFILISIIALSIMACTPMESKRLDDMESQGSSGCPESYAQGSYYYLTANNGSQKVAAVRVSGSGYGAPPKKYYPESQRRLMAMRASKIDAYRALAEIVDGVHIWGGTTIGDMVVQRDRYRVYMDTFVRGARIIEVSAHQDGSYETVVEVVIDQNLLNHVLPLKQACEGQFISAPVQYVGNSPAANFYYSE